jgi:hypothetical protein
MESIFDRIGITLCAILIGFVMGWFLHIAIAHAGVFDGEPITQIEKNWFNNGYVQSCCGLGDAFTADDFVEIDGKYYAIITDGTDRYWDLKDVIPVGTRFEITPEMYQHTKDFPKNPTGHGIIFLHVYRQKSETGSVILGYHTGATEPVPPEQADVMCYFPPAGNWKHANEIIAMGWW